MTLSKHIIEDRLQKLFLALNSSPEKYDTAIIIGRINLYYYTGTMQDGLLVLRSNGDSYFFVRKSADRAKIESPFKPIYKIQSYRDMRTHLPEDLGSVYIETESVPIAMLDRIRKHFAMDRILPLDRLIALQRAVKSAYELEFIRESGRRHQILMEKTVPSLLREGMSETDFAAELYAEMIKSGHHGVSRFSMFQMEMIIGQLGFGETSLYPTNFDGPGGMQGMYPVVPIIGNRDRTLKKGDSVFVDVGFGYMGYHSDKTQVYSFRSEPDETALQVHRACIGVLEKAASLIKPGANPSDIYQVATNDLPEVLSEHFMGYGSDSVKFLGHGVGLYIDELPIISAGYSIPLQENMVIALEPKRGVEGVGMIGVEETFVVTKAGAECITGGPLPIMVIPT
jgi:Xaa-Pro aminopeptidase